MFFNYRNLHGTLGLLTQVSAAFEEDVNILTAKNEEKYNFEAMIATGSEDIDIDAEVEVDDAEKALMNMTLFQKQVSEAANSTQRKAAFDLAMGRMLLVEEGINKTLDTIRNDKRAFVVENRPVVKTYPKPEAKVKESEISADFRMISGCKVRI